MMKNFKVIIILGLVIVFLNNCKKEELTLNADELAGTWIWVTSYYAIGYPTSDSFTMTLEFKEREKYEIRRNGKKIEEGRLVYHNSDSLWFDFILEFAENEMFMNDMFKVEFFRNKKQFYDVCAIKFYGQDTIRILEHYRAEDTPIHIYVRE